LYRFYTCYRSIAHAQFLISHKSPPNARQYIHTENIETNKYINNFVAGKSLTYNLIKSHTAQTRLQARNNNPSGQNHQNNNLKECVFVNSALKIVPVPCCQKYTLTDCCFGDFAHWDIDEIFILLIFAFGLNFIRKRLLSLLTFVYHLHGMQFNF